MAITISPVRKAVPDDEEELMQMCRALHAENGIFPLSEWRIRNLLHRAFGKVEPSDAMVGVIRRSNVIEGMILMLIGQFYYTDDWCLEELFNYVRPEYRKSTNAKDLVSFGKRCADELGIPLVIGIVSNERTKAKIELYRRQLGDPIGAYFVHRPASAGSNVAQRAAG